MSQQLPDYLSEEENIDQTVTSKKKTQGNTSAGKRGKNRCFNFDREFETLQKGKDFIQNEKIWSIMKRKH